MKLRMLAALLLLLFGSTCAWAEGPRVEFFSPEGTVKGVRQVAARFSQQMVAFGDLRLGDPFDVSCPEKGKGRWADGKNWVYDFEKDIPAGVVCEFTLKPGLKDVKGEEVDGKRTFSFSTGGPAIIDSYPDEGDTIDEDQIFFLRLDAEAVEETVVRNVSCSIEGINEKVAVEIIKGALKERLVKEVSWLERRFSGPTTLAIKCRRNFPNGKVVRLVWGAGVKSVSGVATDKDRAFAFKSRKPFEARFTCEREHADAGCIPILPMEVRFTAPVLASTASKVVLRNYMGAYQPEPPREEYVDGVIFKGPFPPNMPFLIEIPSDIKDDAGRSLSNRDKFPLSVETGPYPALAKFAANFGILERSNPYLPLTVRNIEAEIRTRGLEIPADPREISTTLNGKMQTVSGDIEVMNWYRKLLEAEDYVQHYKSDSRSRSLLINAPDALDFLLPKPNGKEAFEVLGITLDRPGFHVVEMESLILGQSLLGKPAPMYVKTGVLVTNLSAHFKWGRESSLVWVTTLDKGEPVKDATVTIRRCDGSKIWEGKTDSQGIAYIGETIDAKGCYGELYGLFIFARTADDMTFTRSTWDSGIEPWRFNLPEGYYQSPMIEHTVLDRSLFRAGETVHMKHITRKRTMEGFSLPGYKELPKEVLITHTGSDQTFKFPLEWYVSDGVAETTWKIPEEAKLGTYGISMGGSFRVEEFKVPLMKGSIDPPEKPLINAEEATLKLSASYLSGGGAEGLPAKLRTQVSPRYVYFDDYEGFQFANGEIKEEVHKSGRGGEDEGEEAAPATTSGPKVSTYDLTLGSGGLSAQKVTDIPKSPAPQNLFAEMEFRDPNGQIVTVARSIPLWPSSVLVGVKPDSWVSSRDTVKFHVATVDVSGRPVGGVEVKTEFFNKSWYSHRRRLIGGFYSYESTSEMKRLGPGCEGKTNEKGILICEMKPPASGSITVQARAVDREGNPITAHAGLWVAGEERWWEDVSDSDRIDLLPEKKSYEPWETARFQVRMPFSEATALVTVEREGVVESYVRTVSSKDPVVEVPIKENYAPNVFVSVLCVRGRVGDVQPTALADLGKPAFKLGIAEIKVGWKAHELKVKVSADKEVYKVRQKASVKIKVTRADGGKLPKNSEVAVAAVDEGLLELMPNESWKLLEEMMTRRGYEVRTSTAQMQVVGKRHFGLKARPDGGGGGKQSSRELFDTLLSWQGRVMLDENGEASVEIPINDSLTGFTIVAIAQAGVGQFGTGKTNIRTSQDLMLMSGLPAMVREEDRFKATFTVRNASERKMAVEVAAKYFAGEKETSLKPVKVSLGSMSATDVSWDVNVPSGSGSLKWEVSAKEAKGEARDSLKVSQKVVPYIPVRVFQATITQVEKPVTMAVKKPDDALPGKGGVRVSLSPKLATGIDGIQEYMRMYPYSCMEQKVSKAVALRDEAMWKRTMKELPAYMDSEGLVKYFPPCREGSDTLTAYLLSIAHEAGWAIPQNLKEKMEEGLKGFMEGKVVRYSSLPTADLMIRKMAAAQALSRGSKFTPKLLDSIAIDPNLWPTSAVIDWFNVLTRTPAIADRDRKLREVEQIIRSRLNFQGTTMGFSTEDTDNLWWLMVSNDLNAVRAVLSLMEFDNWKEDMPRLLRGALGRQHRGHWDLTLANAWGVLALEKFSNKFEAVPVSGSTAASLSGNEKALSWEKSPAGGSLMFGWPDGGGDLTVVHDGPGKPWATLQSLAAIRLKEPLSTGYKVKKSTSPVYRKAEGKWSPGDVVRIRLELEAQADMTWVVVNDPIPAGASILGTGLGHDSAIFTQGETRTGWVWPLFEERAFEAFRAYYEFVPKGRWTLEYTIRLDNEGMYKLPETRVEALYSPEMFGEIPNNDFSIDK